MKILLLLLAHLLTTVARYLGPGGANAVIAENLLVPIKNLIWSFLSLYTPELCQTFLGKAFPVIKSIPL